VLRPEPTPRSTPRSRRRRSLLAGALALAVAAAVVVGFVLAVASPKRSSRITTLPAADRSASPALVRAAEAVGFDPPKAPGAGSIESAPASDAREPLSDDLLRVGSVAPDFTLRTPTGTRVALADLRGKAVLLEFFSTWCPHCAAEAPHLRTLYESLPPSKFAFVAVDASGADAASVFAYHVYFGLPFPAVLDPDPDADPVTFPEHGTTGPVSRAYKVGFLPTFYVLDPRGRITWRSDGEQPNALLRRELERAAASS
jgi:peroxiredoxin